MGSQRVAKLAVGSIATVGAIFLLGVFGSSPRVQAQNGPDNYDTPPAGAPNELRNDCGK